MSFSTGWPCVVLLEPHIQIQPGRRAMRTSPARSERKEWRMSFSTCEPRVRRDQLRARPGGVDAVSLHLATYVAQRALHALAVEFSSATRFQLRYRLGSSKK